MDFISPPARRTRLRHRGHGGEVLFLENRGDDSPEAPAAFSREFVSLGGSYPIPPLAELDKSKLLTLCDLGASVVSLDSDSALVTTR